MRLEPKASAAFHHARAGDRARTGWSFGDARGAVGVAALSREREPERVGVDETGRPMLRIGEHAVQHLSRRVVEGAAPYPDAPIRVEGRLSIQDEREPGLAPALHNPIGGSYHLLLAADPSRRAYRVSDHRVAEGAAWPAGSG